jgi:cobalt/nickel transport system permease protein
MIIFEDTSRVRLLARLDPRVRLVAALVFSVVICLCRRPSVLGAGLAAGVLLLAGSGMPARRALKRLLGLNAFMLLLAATLPLCVPGRPLLRIGVLAWSDAGLARAAQTALRANAVMLTVTALVGTMETAYLGFALNGIGVPDRFTHLLVFMVRYLEVVHRQYHRLRDAMLLRAFRPRFDRHTLRTFGFLVGQLLVRSADRSERILEAMKCRGFRGRYYVLAPCRMHAADIGFAAAAAAGLAALAVMEWR